MKLSSLLSIYAVVAAISCVLYLAFPSFAMALYGQGVAADPQAVMNLRMVGALFGGISVMTWLSRSAEPSASRDALVHGLTALNGLAAAVAAWSAVSGVYNQYAWGPFVTCAAFAIGFLVVGPALSPSEGKG